jgi:hypothetical protein
MLITFAVLVVAAAVSPVIWFSWWLLADVVESRSRRAAAVMAMPRAARAAGIPADQRERAA